MKENRGIHTLLAPRTSKRQTEAGMQEAEGFGMGMCARRKEKGKEKKSS